LIDPNGLSAKTFEYHHGLGIGGLEGSFTRAGGASTAGEWRRIEGGLEMMMIGSASSFYSSIGKNSNEIRQKIYTYNFYKLINYFNSFANKVTIAKGNGGFKVFVDYAYTDFLSFSGTGVNGEEIYYTTVVKSQEIFIESFKGDASYKLQSNGGTDDLGLALSAASFGTGVYADYLHNHKTYTTTAGETRSIYKANGKYRSANAARYGQMSKYIKGLGVAGAIVSTGYSANNVYNQYKAGGVGNINPLDATDVGVGVIGLGTTGLVAVGLVSNPVGWVIGIGVTVYFGGRLIYDLVKD
jgi:hypothetical protein